MRVYVILLLTILWSLVCRAADNDDHEVKVVGDQNYNNTNLVYDGIDVSNYQKDINWKATAEDPSIKYVYVKATEGATHKQHRYRRNIENARQHGVKVGSYHFLSTTSPIQKQFENFISMAKPEEQDLIPLLDVETHAGWSVQQLQDSVMLFVQLLEEYYGCKPMIYTSVSYFNTKLGYDFKNYPLFIARYSKKEPQLNFGAKWILWQFSDCGVINGIDAMVDLSRFNRGCSLKDITYHAPKSKKKDKPRHNVPRPKPKAEAPKTEVPYPANQRNTSNGEKTDAQKRGEENEKKRKKLEEKKRKEEQKAQEKARKEEEKKRKEIEKREKELEKKRQELEKKQREQEEKQRKAEEQRKARDNAQERMKADKERSSQTEREQQLTAEQQRKSNLERAKQERLEREKANDAASGTTTTTTTKKNVKKSNNQSSADNEEFKYNRRGKKK